MSRSLLGQWYVVAVALSGCDRPESVTSYYNDRAVFDDYFTITRSLRLEDESLPGPGQVAAFYQTSNGDFLLASAAVPRVVRVDSAGRLLHQAGAYGEVPGLFRRLGGVIEAERGKIVALDPVLGRLTILAEGLVADTVLGWTNLIGPLVRFREGMLVGVVTAPRSRALMRLDSVGESIWQVPFEEPELEERPYWQSYANMVVASSSDLVIIAHSLLYSLRVYDRSGALLRSIQSAPPSFRMAQVLEPGAFVGVGGDARRSEWLESFDVVATATVIGDSTLVVVRGRLSRDRSTGRVTSKHESLDLFHLNTLEPVAQNIALPENTRVLGAHGGELFLMRKAPEASMALLAVSPIARAGAP